MSAAPSQPDSILFIKPGSLGDVVHALPVAAALHRAWPQSRISWVIDPRWAAVLEGNPAVKERVPFPRQEFRGLFGFIKGARWLARLRFRQPDLAIDLQCLLRSALVSRASRSRHVIGLSDAREGARFFYNESARVRDGQHAVDRYLSVLPLLGLSIPDEPEFFLGSGEPVEVPGNFTLLHPYARGAGKSLDEPAVRALCEQIDGPIVLVGIGRAPAQLPDRVRDLIGKTTLPQLIWLLRRARAVISVDSGPMHLAAAVGARLLSIHTWSDPRLVGPYTRSAWIWQGGEVRRQDLDRPPLPERPLTNRDLDAIAAWAHASA